MRQYAERIPGFRFSQPLFLIAVFLVAELLVNPLRNFPLNDDWSYSKSVLWLLEENEINIGDWGAMTLATHILWGGLFAKAFGFSFIVLRLSTLVSALAGITTVYYLVKRMSCSSSHALLAALTFMFNPVYFNLSNTFMTDVNFLTLLILFFNFTHLLFISQKPLYFVVLCIIGVMLVLLRQLGVVVGIPLLAASFFVKQARWQNVLLSCALIIVVVLSFYLYEAHLRTYLSSWSPYPFSGKFKITESDFYISVFQKMRVRLPEAFIQILVWFSPFAVFFLGKLLRLTSLRLSLMIGSVAILLVLSMRDVHFPLGNIFQNYLLGPEPFYQNIVAPQGDVRLPRADLWIMLIRYGCSFISLMVIGLIISTSFKDKRSVSRPMWVLFLVFCGSYLFLLLISESFFDRYMLPLGTVVLILAAASTSKLSVSLFSPHLFLLILFAFVSVAGTRDYLEVNAIRWKAYADLKHSGAQASRINAGFEVNCWNEGQYTWWTDFMKLDDYDYLIQFRPEAGFALVQNYPFKRYLFYRPDTLRSFAREAAAEK